MRRSVQRSADRSWIVAAAYVAAMVLFVYLVADPAVTYGSDVGNIAALVGLAVLHAATGWFANRWWAMLLPLVAVLLSVPAGYPEDRGGEPLPIWFGMAAFVAPVGAVLISAGVLTRRALARHA
jgi:NAD/NADP transhydrogenase beta subunit